MTIMYRCALAKVGVPLWLGVLLHEALHAKRPPGTVVIVAVIVIVIVQLNSTHLSNSKSHSSHSRTDN